MTAPDHAMEEARTRHQRLAARYQELMQQYQKLVAGPRSQGSFAQWLLHNAPDGVALVQEGHILHANRRFYRLCAGEGAHRSAGEPGRASCHATMRRVLETARELAADPDFRRRQERFADVGPERLCLDATFEEVAGVEPRQIAVTLRDVTETERLRRLGEEARRQERSLALLAHELRNPLAPIRAAAELILGASDDPRVRRAAETIRRQVEHQGRLVEDLLESARIREGKLRLERETADLRELLHEAIAATEPYRAHLRALHVSLPPEPVWVEADRTRVIQAAVNLLHNAAKYTEPGGENWLECARRATAPGCVCGTTAWA